MDGNLFTVVLSNNPILCYYSIMEEFIVTSVVLLGLVGVGIFGILMLIGLFVD